MAASVMSLTATISMSGAALPAARKTLRPMRPNPLMATRTLMRLPLKIATGIRPPCIHSAAEGVGRESSAWGDRQNRAASDGVWIRRAGMPVTRNPCLPMLAGAGFSGDPHLGDILGFCTGNEPSCAGDRRLGERRAGALGRARPATVDWRRAARRRGAAGHRARRGRARDRLGLPVGGGARAGQVGLVAVGGRLARSRVPLITSASSSAAPRRGRPCAPGARGSSRLLLA